MRSDRVSEANYEWERRFIVRDVADLPDALACNFIRQAYLWHEDGYSVRVRIACRSDNPADISRTTLALKGPRIDASRYEVESDIDAGHAIRVYASADSKVVKYRMSVQESGEIWEIDFFEGANSGLVIAEFEGSRETVQSVTVPAWAAEEITDDERYNNERLAVTPWPAWRTV